MKLRHLLSIVCGGLWLIMSLPLQAALTIQITEGVVGAMPIAIVPFDNSTLKSPLPYNLSDIITTDLGRSGRFAPMPEQDLIARPHDGSAVRFADWRLLNMESLVVGRLRELGGARYEVQFQLFDVFKGEQLAGYSIAFAADDVRRTAHRISDLIYEKLTGQRGAFSTRIAYITAIKAADKSREYRLSIADADGFNEQVILDSKQPLMSPSWSPDGEKLVYVTFESGRPEIFVQEVFSGERRRITDFPGLNNAPVWSPDGRYLAMTLSKTGNPEVHTYNLQTGALSQVTRHPGIDTEPNWSPDGRKLVFTSDRGGRPQLYMVNMSGANKSGQPQRLTFEGEYNSRGTFSPDGQRLAMVHGQQGAFRIAVLELASRNLQVLTDSRLDESPSFAPNGSMIIYATESQNRGVLAAVSVDGRVHQRLELQQGDVREPAWSPFSTQ
ncbi:Tol-Pal system beta propeller repeat protein TolB [Sulfuriflexus sp.]|uniref:Tol-Pal system beta propeller repeat protein TolB n=1 Tax=Sulfuriflexus sp. TaxID=2015443 RepID=UPI0028CC4144|nr:Tol-Pal system beta propeller repeat protein TolB [Sulfuriflexus sp.]MDT8404262.1 Tol-Pal system beta propeller repeat protein TolB [Sulfuriflexus sp.]